jgi:hypothetical protein
MSTGAGSNPANEAAVEWARAARSMSLGVDLEWRTERHWFPCGNAAPQERCLWDRKAAAVARCLSRSVVGYVRLLWWGRIQVL